MITKIIKLLTRNNLKPTIISLVTHKQPIANLSWFNTFYQTGSLASVIWNELIQTKLASGHTTVNELHVHKLYLVYH